MNQVPELLALAAKAAGYTLEWCPEWPGGGCVMKRVTPTPTDPTEDVRHPWNPADDDGDGARLEADVGIDLKWFRSKVSATHLDENNQDYFYSATYAAHGGDKKAARRWASLQVAAAIAKAMP